MKLLDFSEAVGQVPNFGDDLNLDVWPIIRPDLFRSGPTLFAGFGTLLTEGVRRRYAREEIIFFTSGAGYKILEALPASWTVLAVRGPLTESALNLKRGMAVADGAILAPSVLEIEGSRGLTGPAFMPHVTTYTLHSKLLRAACRAAGIELIDPRESRSIILNSIASSSIILTEALHGAIVADACRIPWIRCHTGPHINNFKWQDYAASLELDSRPFPVPIPTRTAGLQVRLRSVRAVRLAGRSARSTALDDYRQAFFQSSSFVASRLRSAIETGGSQLSNARLLMRKQNEILRRFEAL